MQVAECREHKRWIERENARLRSKQKKEETRRLREFVDRAYALDPRVLAKKEEARAEREAKKAEKERARLEKEEAERRAAEEAAAAKAAKDEAAKKLAADAKKAKCAATLGVQIPREMVNQSIGCMGYILDNVCVVGLHGGVMWRRGVGSRTKGSCGGNESGCATCARRTIALGRRLY